MRDDTTPVLIGAGEVTDTDAPPENARSPFDLMAAAARRALADAGDANVLAPAIDVVAVPQLFADSAPRYAGPLGNSSNPPKSVARRLQLDPARLIYTHIGGDTPQVLVNRFAESIALGETDTALIVGGEALRSQRNIQRAGLDVSWIDDPGGPPEIFGTKRAGVSAHEARHGLGRAVAVYPLFENAIRSARSRTVDDHMQAMGRLMARLARVAADNPLAARRERFSAARLARIDDANRWVGFPYPRLMNAHVFVDQAAALLMTSVGRARALGVPRSRWVFLRGHADCHDHWHVSERADLSACPAIGLGARRALDMAGTSLADLDFFDLYSCFPSAVEIACRELGLAEDDPRGLTVTGGLPYFGGPGNNYVTHSIAQMMHRLRATPGSYGLITANGYYLTKHAFGVYSSQPPADGTPRDDSAGLQREIDARERAAFTPTPKRRGFIETYTVMYGRNGPERSVIVARESESGRRFLATTTGDAATLRNLIDIDSLGRPGTVHAADDRNVFVPD